jgi:hypothetical protein
MQTGDRVKLKAVSYTKPNTTRLQRAIGTSATVAGHAADGSPYVFLIFDNHNDVWGSNIAPAVVHVDDLALIEDDLPPSATFDLDALHVLGTCCQARKAECLEHMQSARTQSDHDYWAEQESRADRVSWLVHELIGKMQP